MTTITIVKDTDLITVDDLRQVASAERGFIPLVTAKWGKPVCKIQYSDHRIDGTWNFIVTDKNSFSGAYGYHTVENGLPVGYISPSAIGLNPLYPKAHQSALYGLCIPAQPPVKIGKVTIFKGAPAVFYPGLVTVLAEEIAEAIVDPTPLNPGEWRTDGDGNTWLVEIDDHVSGHRFTQTSTTTLMRPKKVKGKQVMVKTRVSQTCVFPDFTLPAFYDVKGVAPFSYLNTPVKPFEHLTGAYAYIKGVDGGQLEQFARKDDAD